MNAFKNKEGKPVLLAMVKAIQDNKAYLGEVDGLIGDGDHGMNMNKGFTIFETRFADKDFTFTEGLDDLGTILLTEIGGSMGPIYGTILMDMAEAGGENPDTEITPEVFARMLKAGLDGLQGIVDAKVGDKTLVDTLSPAAAAMEKCAKEGTPFKDALALMKQEAVKGQQSTKDMVAKFGRSSRLGERSRGVLDAGATSCAIILSAMADAMSELIKN